MYPRPPEHGEAETPKQETSIETLYARHNKVNFPFLRTPLFVAAKELTGYKHTQPQICKHKHFFGLLNNSFICI